MCTKLFCEGPAQSNGIDRDEAGQGKSRQQRSCQQAYDPLPVDDDPLSEQGRAVQDKVDRGLHIGQQGRLFWGEPGRNRDQVFWFCPEMAFVRMKSEDQSSGPGGIHLLSLLNDFPHTGVAVLQRVGDLSCQLRDRRVDRHVRRNLASVKEHLRARTDGRKLGFHQDLSRSWSGQRLFTYGDLARRVEPD